MSFAIELRGLTWRAGRLFTLRDLDLCVRRGSIYGFLGPNGSGKTSTIRLFMGMIRPHAGEIRLLGEPIPARLPQALARVGYVPERPHVYPAFTVDEALRYHASYFERWDAGRAQELLDRLGLHRRQRVGRLSKGETGKLLMLLALAQRPELLVLDEPTDGLDPVIRRDVMTALVDYVSESGATVFISSHLVHELERVCDWVGILDRGRLVAELPMESFKNGIKRVHLTNAPLDLGEAPFDLLARRANGLVSGEIWVVRGWEARMSSYLETVGATVKDVIDLDLEDGFVELLSSSRPVPTRE